MSNVLHPCKVSFDNVIGKWVNLVKIPLVCKGDFLIDYYCYFLNKSYLAVKESDLHFLSAYVLFVIVCYL